MPAITSRALIVAAPLALLAIAAGLGMFAVGCEPDEALFRPVDQVAEDARTDSVGLIDGSGDTAQTRSQLRLHMQRCLPRFWFHLRKM